MNEFHDNLLQLTQPPTANEPLSVPDDLHDRGVALWVSATSEFVFNDAELELLFEACQTLDSLHELKQFQAERSPITRGSMGQEVISPVLDHIDKLRKTYASQLKALNLSGTEQIELVDNRTLSEKRRDTGRKGAEVRWNTKAGA